MTVAGVHGAPEGLSVVIVIVTTFPISASAGVYVNENGDVEAEDGDTVPDPFSVIVTLVALPPNVLSLTVSGVVPQVLPEELLRVIVGGFAHPHDTSKLGPSVVHP